MSGARGFCAIASACVLWFTPAAAQSTEATPAPALRFAIAGLVHGHAQGFLRAAQKRTDAQLVGVFEPDVALQQQYAKDFGLRSDLFFIDLGTMLDRVKPEAVASFASTFDHLAIVEACAARHVNVMVEKPLAVSVDSARAMQRAAERAHIQVVVNYETTWYPSHGLLWTLIKERRAAGEIRKMIAMDGHNGPKEIGVGPEFLGWLTDPVQNGAGALFDFGCYGANLMTWLMDEQPPLAVTAVTQQMKPAIYPRVDDEATVLLEYPRAQGIIQASWNWPFGRKDLEVYGEKGYAGAIGGATLRVHLPGQAEEALSPEPRPIDERDAISYLIAVTRGRRVPSGLSSLANNVIVVEILEAARESARLHQTIRLKP